MPLPQPCLWLSYPCFWVGGRAKPLLLTPGSVLIHSVIHELNILGIIVIEPDMWNWPCGWQVSQLEWTREVPSLRLVLGKRAHAVGISTCRLFVILYGDILGFLIMQQIWIVNAICSVPNFLHTYDTCTYLQSWLTRACVIQGGPERMQQLWLLISWTSSMKQNFFIFYLVEH